MVKLKFRNFLGQILEKPGNKEKTESREDNDDKKNPGKSSHLLLLHNTEQRRCGFTCGYM